MAFRKRRSLPSTEINLIPMLDVLMTVLTFFIIVSMTLALDRGVKTGVAGNAGSAVQSNITPMVVRLSSVNVLVDDRPVEAAQVLPLVRRYLLENSQGKVLLRAEPQVSYEAAVQLLGELKSVGGDRVLLAIE
jgi:biopolymer transport protein ExbD